MRFIVDEMPNFMDECPFSKAMWDDTSWIYKCSLTSEKCNLYEEQGVCHGLKELKGADDE